MTTSNGDARARLREVREQRKLARAERELAQLQFQARLLQESYYGFTGNGWGDLVDPMDSVRDTNGMRAAPLGGRSDRRDGGNRPFFWNDIDLQVARSQARWIATRNPFAIGAIDRFTDYTIRTGYQYQAQPAKRAKNDATAAALADMVQEVVDEFCDINLWPQMEREAFQVSRRDGEALIRCFDQGDGTTLARPVWSEQLYKPLGSPPLWSWGIETEPHDIQTPTRYAITYDPDQPDDWECVDAADVAHIKLNVDSCVKRGLSDFYSTGDAFDQTDKLLRALRVNGAMQASIAWVEKYTGANAGGVADRVNAARDLYQPYQMDAITGKTINAQRWVPGSIPQIGVGKDYEPGPLAQNTSQHIAIVQAALRALGARWGIPEYMISGDASNNNFASILVAGSPFVTHIECEQDRYRIFFLRVLWIAIRNAANAGRFILNGRAYTSKELQRLVDIHVTPPSVAIANTLQDAQVDAIDMQNGVLSKQTRAESRGLDYERERQNIAADPVRPPAPPGQPPTSSQGLFPANPVREDLFPRHAVAARLVELRERYGDEATTLITESARRLLPAMAAPIVESVVPVAPVVSPEMIEVEEVERDPRTGLVVKTTRRKEPAK